MQAKIKVEGMSQLLNRLSRISESAAKKARDITEIKAQEITASAKRNARNLGVLDNGNLVQGIHYKDDSGRNIKYDIIAREPYSAYHEFGTGRLVEIPDGWGELAAQFKGKGVRDVNIAARPFLYPAFKDGVKTYLKDLKFAIKQELNG